MNEKLLYQQNPQHATQFTPQWFLCQSHIITICYGVGKAMIQHIYPCKECSYYKILSIFLPQQSKKICILVQLGLVSRKKSSQKNLFNFFLSRNARKQSDGQIWMQLNAIECS